MYDDPGYRGYTLNKRMSWPRQTDLPGYAEDPYDITMNQAEADRLIENAVQGEAEDRQFYQYLISAAPSAKDRSIIAGIRDDEMKHYQMFRQIYNDLTGNSLPVLRDVPVGRPVSYCAGLQKALMGEQNAVAKYRRILYAMMDRRHINMMTEIITDELRHLGLYNYLFAKNKCTD